MKKSQGAKRLVVVAGPTGVGKTAASILLAGHLGAEIISADSRQIFRELTIGTAKPSEVELSSAKHHFINSHSITEVYDAARFGRDALDLIDTLHRKSDDVILCGGSGLYIKAVCDGFDDIPEVPDDVRETLIAGYEGNGLEWLQAKMVSLDPEHFKVIDQQNPHRLIRALEVKLGTGQSITSFQKKARLDHSFDIVKIGFELPREVLFARIDQRMDEMIARGLFEEAEALYPYKEHQALQTVGYQEIFDWMDGKYDRDEAVRLLKRNSRRYAKRQLTWFKRDEEFRWFTPGDLHAIISYLNHEGN